MIHFKFITYVLIIQVKQLLLVPFGQETVPFTCCNTTYILFLIFVNFVLIFVITQVQHLFAVLPQHLGLAQAPFIWTT